MKAITNKAAKKQEKKARMERLGLPIEAVPSNVDWYEHFKSLKISLASTSNDIAGSPSPVKASTQLSSSTGKPAYSPDTYGELATGHLEALKKDLEKLAFRPMSKISPAVSQGIESIIQKLGGDTKAHLPDLPRKLCLFDQRLKSTFPAEPRISLFIRLLIHKHLNVLRRKKAMVTTVDEYGFVDSRKWLDEKRRFVTTVISRTLRDEIDCNAGQIETLLWGLGLRPLSDMTFDILSAYIEEVVDRAATSTEPVLVSDGHAYEHFVAEMFRKAGVRATVTQGSGDNGADILLVTADGETLVAQCKWYTSPVGNKAVQEVYSAMGIYDASQAWVVTNSSYTVAAKAAANKLGVLLIHHDEITTIFGIA